MGLYECPECGSNDVVFKKCSIKHYHHRDGSLKTRRKLIDRYRCNSCDHRFKIVKEE